MGSRPSRGRELLTPSARPPRGRSVRLDCAVMRLSLRDPRTRAILLLILILLLGALTLHLVGMADQGMGMAIGACLAILVAIGLLVVLPPLRPWLALAP